MDYIKFFHDISLHDIALVGGKNASLGFLINNLKQLEILVPQGFALTTNAYYAHLLENNLIPLIEEHLSLIKKNPQELSIRAQIIREHIAKASLPQKICSELYQAYKELSSLYNVTDCYVAVRSSATTEDLPDASYAGQQDSFLYIQGIDALLKSCTQTFASLFTDRALLYRQEKNICHSKIALSVGIQKMVASDLACSGVMFTLDTETGFKDALLINASYGLGEALVQGIITPDEFCIYKPLCNQNFKPLIKKICGSKETKLIYNYNTATFTSQKVTPTDQKKFCLSEKEIFELASMGIRIEKLYSSYYNAPLSLDIEWAKDGIDRKIYIVQARPETIHSTKKYTPSITSYSFNAPLTTKPLLKGQSIGEHIISGKVHHAHDPHDMTFVSGDILVTRMTTPDWLPLIKKASALITDQGGRTCHAAIVSRELNIPALIGTEQATKVLKEGQTITLDCSQGAYGVIYEGIHHYTKKITPLQNISKSPVPLLINLADPAQAFKYSFLPVHGIGLARTEFIITSSIKVHPLACTNLEKVDGATQKSINDLSQAFTSPQEYFIDTLAHEIGMLAAAFYPKPVIVRLTDFKSNEYRNLLGGSFFEPYEENPMLGFRGAARYIHSSYQSAFALECAAFKKARTILGFSNIKIMIPFVRTVQEAHDTLCLLTEHGLSRDQDKLEIYMMIEIPSNILLFEKFAPLFDGFSIGSNDLTQLTLGIDRDSELLIHKGDERNEAVTLFLEMILEKAHKAHKYISICGQAPSDFPEIADFLIKKGITALSLNPDSILPFLTK